MNYDTMFDFIMPAGAEFCMQGALHPDSHSVKATAYSTGVFLSLHATTDCTGYASVATKITPGVCKLLPAELELSSDGKVYYAYLGGSPGACEAGLFKGNCPPSTSSAATAGMSTTTNDVLLISLLIAGGGIGLLIATIAVVILGVVIVVQVVLVINKKERDAADFAFQEGSIASLPTAGMGGIEMPDTHNPIAKKGRVQVQVPAGLPPGAVIVEHDSTSDAGGAEGDEGGEKEKKTKTKGEVALRSSTSAFVLKEFLLHVGMGEYEASLRAEGFDNVSSLRDLEKDDLKEIGVVKLAHRKAIMKAIALL